MELQKLIWWCGQSKAINLPPIERRVAAIEVFKMAQEANIKRLRKELGLEAENTKT